MVVCKTPFRSGTQDHYPDDGMHVTVEQEKKDKKGVVTKRIPDFAEAKVGGRPVKVVLDLKTIKFIRGQAQNDFACGGVFYVACELGAETKALVRSLQEELGADTKGFLAHVSFAMVTPVQGQTPMHLAAMRAAWAPSPPPGGYAKPQETLIRKPDVQMAEDLMQAMFENMMARVMLNAFW